MRWGGLVAERRGRGCGGEGEERECGGWGVQGTPTHSGQVWHTEQRRSTVRVAGCGTPTRWWCRRGHGRMWHTDARAGRGEQTRGTQLRDLRAASSHVWPGGDVSRGVWVAHVAGLPLWAALVRWSVGVLRRGGEEGVKRRKRKIERRMLVWVWVWRREEEGAPNRPVWQSVWPHRCCRWRSGGRGRRVWPWAQQWAWRLAYSCAWRSA